MRNRRCTSPERAVYLMAVPGFADWEPAHALAELRRHGQYRVEVVGFTREPVESMGGLRVLPTRTLAEVEPREVAVFILPGGDRWESQPLEPELRALLHRLDDNRVPVAAICGATLAIARAGLLRGRQHTSNGLDYLRQQVPEYRDDVRYIDAPAVRDGTLITANGLADIEFAREIFAVLNVLSEADRQLWSEMFRTGHLPAGDA